MTTTDVERKFENTASTDSSESRTLEDFDFREWRMQREKVDFLAAVSQKLCSVDSSSTGSFSDFIHPFFLLKNECPPFANGYEATQT